MKRPLIPIIAVTLMGQVAIAHTGVRSPEVQAWMTGMERLADATKTLGDMARGKSPFDPDRAANALTLIERRAAEIPVLFETPAADPKSEARDSIWMNWDDFVKRSGDLAAVAASPRITDTDQLRRVLAEIGGACKSCHADYRD